MPASMLGFLVLYRLQAFLLYRRQALISRQADVTRFLYLDLFSSLDVCFGISGVFSFPRSTYSGQLTGHE